MSKTVQGKHFGENSSAVNLFSTNGASCRAEAREDDVVLSMWRQTTAYLDFVLELYTITSSGRLFQISLLQQTTVSQRTPTDARNSYFAG